MRACRRPFEARFTRASGTPVARTSETPMDASAPGWKGRHMSEAKDADKVIDPKEQMKAALEAKKNASHANTQGAQGGPKASGGPHGQQGGKRTFRRKAGG